MRFLLLHPPLLSPVVWRRFGTAQAQARRWSVEHLPGRHLDVLGRTQDVASVVVQATIT